MNSNNSNWLGKSTTEYTPDQWKNSKEIEIEHFRQIFTWPLVLRIDSTSHLTSKDQLEDAKKKLKKSLNKQGSKWQPVTNLADYAKPPHNTTDPNKRPARFEQHSDQAARYSEFVYFYDFIQSTLYEKADGKKNTGKPLALYRRTDICKLQAQIDIYGNRLEFCANVEHVNLYTFETGGVMLSMEIEFGSSPMVRDSPPCEKCVSQERPMTLADVQNISDQLRRVYAPFYFVNNNPKFPPFAATSRAPVSFAFLDKGNKEVISFSHPVENQNGTKTDNTVLDDALNTIHTLDSNGKRNSPLLPYWQELLSPIAIAGQTNTDNAPVYRQVVDERIPMMSFIQIGKICEKPATASDALRAINRGDWMRICYADESGSQTLPYSADFMKDFEQDCCYDRFFPSGATASDVGSRIMFSGYHFSVVAAGDFAETSLVHHFRRHYFQMALVIQIEIISLLATSARISYAVKHLMEKGQNKQAKNRFIKEIEQIEQNFLEYTHLFHFTGLSNQLQPNEMFEIWRKQAGLEKTYADVKEEVQSANNFLNISEQKQLAEASHNLNVIASIGVFFGLVFSFFGMNIIVSSASNTGLAASLSNPGHWGLMGIVIVIFAVFGALLISLFNYFNKLKHRPTNWRATPFLLCFFVIGLLTYGFSTQISAAITTLLSMFH